MKKSIVFLAAFFIVALAALAATGTGWVKVKDTCNNCTITELEYKCGKCSSAMKSGKATVKPDHWLEYPFKCTKCTHSCTYKCKY